MAVITIDGIRLEVPEGKKILDCALDAGIYIPHLCHHPDLEELGSCRLCVVEVKGEEGTTTSCTLRARDGLEICTKSDEISRLRMLALELLLTGHPEDCTTCPKYGTCELQMLIQYIGPRTGRLKSRTKGFRLNENNPLILHDMNRCVLCGRCVRACNELRGVEVLQYRKKEMETYVGTLHDKLLIDADCKFCQACVEVCPTGTIREKLTQNEDFTSREDSIIPCKGACPAHTEIPRYIRYVKEKKYDEAAAVIREKLPFPKALGMVCTHVCELECKRKELNEAMSIREIKRYAMEKDKKQIWRTKGKQLQDTGKRVCIVGAGPTGMTAAYYLKKQGHQVTVKEELPTVGGMLSYGIPSYRLPREIVAEEAEIIIETGIRLETNTKIDRPKELLAEFDAVLMAIGSHKGVRLPIEGAELQGVLLNTEFLKMVNLEEKTKIGQKVVVLGGGNVAFDCARTALRLGAKEVALACLEEKSKMTADTEEISQAEEEGIKIYPARTFERITGTDSVTGVDFMKVKSFTFDENRRAVIEKEEGSEQHINADTIIFAVGQRPDITEEFGLEIGKGNCILTKEGSCETNCSKIFAAGDAVYGTKSVIMAIAAGREAAEKIDLFLGGDGDISEHLAPEEKPKKYIGKEEHFGYKKRVEAKVADSKERSNNFNLVNLGISDEDIEKEVGRCLQCDLRLHITKPRTWADYTNSREEKV